MLLELHYKDFMGEIIPNNVAGATNNKLPFRDWQPLVKSVHYRGYRKDTLKFFVPNKYNGWETYIQFPEMQEQIDDDSITPQEAARLLFWGGTLRVHCGCPSFSFWGFQYIATQLDAAIIPETRYPKVRNPQLKGIVCKHLIKTLKVLPFHLGDIASVIADHRQKMPKPMQPKAD